MKDRSVQVQPDPLGQDLESPLEIPEERDQLAFFFIDPPQSDLSHTIEFLVGSPRFFRGKNPGVPRTQPGTIIVDRKFEQRGLTHSIKTTPALIETKIEKDGKIVKDEYDNPVTEEIYYYPGSDVELVEDVLIRIGTQGHGEFRTDDKGNTVFAVYFTIRQIAKELESQGKQRSHAEILHTLNVGAKCMQEIFMQHTDGKTTHILSPIFKSFIHTDRKGWESADEQEGRHCYIELHNLVVPCVKSQSFRKFNYIQNQKYSSTLAQWMHKRMSHFYVQAGSDTTPYYLLLSTIINLYGSKPYGKPSDNHKEVVIALDEMKAKGDVLAWDYELQRDPKDKRKTRDYKYSIWASERFTVEMMLFNKDFSHRNPKRVKEILPEHIKTTSAKDKS